MPPSLEEGELHQIVSSHTLFPRDNGTNRLLGPFFVGVVVNYFLWGIQVLQSYQYYKNFVKKDRLALKAAVALLFIVDSFQSICASESAWTFLIQKWGHQGGLFEVRSWGLNVLPLISAVNASIVHVIFAHKIWRLLLGTPSKHIWTITVISLSSLQLTAGTGCTILLLVIDATITEIHRADVWGWIWIATASATDVLITVVILVKLSTSRTGFKETDYLISKLIWSIIETGSATSLAQVLDLALYLVFWPSQTYCIIPAFISPKVYIISTLALLNCRHQGTTDQIHSSRQDTSNNTIQFGPVVSATNTYDSNELYRRPGIESRSSRSLEDEHYASDLKSIDSSPSAHGSPS